MKSYFLKTILMFSVFSLLLTSKNLMAENNQPTQKKIVGYYTDWSIYRKPSFKPSQINGNLLTHLNYAFVKVDANGNLALLDPWADIDYRDDWSTQRPFWGNFNQLVELRKKYPHLKTLFSVGGWSLSDTFSEMADNPNARTHFVQQCIQFADLYQFDGIDIDWEYPCFEEHHGRPQDKKNFTLLLSELYNAAKNHQPPLLVTIAAPASSFQYDNIELDQIASYLDWINIMTYDFYGSWPSNLTTNHNAPLYPPTSGNPELCLQRSVEAYLNHNIPPEKIVVGLAFYGRSFGGVQSSTDGLFASYSGVGGGTLEPGIYFYSDIKANLLSTYTRYWDDHAQVPYLYNAQKREFISYDDERSIGIKTDYIKHNQLGGAMIWELGFDTLPNCDLLKTINQHLKK